MRYVKMKKVLVESPFAGRGESDKEIRKNRKKNVEYARHCLNDCFQKGEAPYASHLLYTQEGILDDDIPEERELGIEAGLLWGSEAEKTVVYLDRGFSKGMARGVRRAISEGRKVEYRVHPERIKSSIIRQRLLKFCETKEIPDFSIYPEEDIWKKYPWNTSKQHSYVHHTIHNISSVFDLEPVEFLEVLRHNKEDRWLSL